MKCYFLDPSEGDFRTITYDEFKARFPLSKLLTATQKGEEYILLSPEGMLKLLGRSSNKNMKIILTK